jgi:ABC-type transport system involved in multi-copper enzyme maturation permease subunit
MSEPNEPPAAEPPAAEPTASTVVPSESVESVAPERPSLESSERISRSSGAFGQAPLPPGRPDLRTRLRDAALAIVRDPNPILLKELRATLRTPLFIRFLYLATGLIAIVVLMGSAGVSEGDTAPAEVGRAIFHLFFGTLAVVLLFAAPSQAASAFTLEKETKTWESLLLSGMSPTRIVLGKFFAIYASILLVVIAVAPVIGVAFLFGGVSPVAVLVAFYWMLGCVSVAVSFGIALSVRLDSTRASVAATTVIFVPLAMMWSGMIVALGEAARSEWGTPFDGPIWFGPAFSERMDQPDAWAFLLGLPTFFFAMVSWLNLSGAIAGIDAPGVDRSSGLKRWSIFAAVGTAAAVVGISAVMNDADDAGAVVVIFGMVALAFIFSLIALVFANEPPLPPRLGAPTHVVRRFVYDTFGPGAGPTLRFTFVVLAAGIGGMGVLATVLRYARFPTSSDHASADLGTAFLTFGGIAVLCALAATAAWLRSLLRNGAAARLLAVVLFVGLTFGSMVGAAVLNPRVIDRLDHYVPPLVGMSPIGPMVLAARSLGHDTPSSEELSTGFAACAVYAGLALALWLAVEFRARQVRGLVDAHRAQLLARLGPAPKAATAIPSGDEGEPPA